MTNDVYDRIIDVCEKAAETIRGIGSHEEIEIYAIGVLTAIAATCVGAGVSKGIDSSILAEISSFSPERKVYWEEYRGGDPTIMHEATFHCWGTNHGIFRSGPETYSTAIIELNDGTVRNVPADSIKFIKDITEDSK